MDSVLGIVKAYFILMLILILFSYLMPKESYRKYVQFFIGVLMAVFLLTPIASWINNSNTEFVYKNYEEITRKLQEIEYNEEGADIFEIFFHEQNP